MNPFREPVFAWQMSCHKLLRYGASVPLLTLAIRALLLAPVKAIYPLAALGYLVFMVLAWAGHKQEKEGKSLSALLSIPYYFVLLNVASYKAFTAFVRGEKKVIWNPRKG